MINQLKSMNREDMFKSTKKPKITFLEKLKIILGYGEKG